MKQKIISAALCLLLIGLSVVQASTCESNDVSHLKSQYIAQTNGMLAVCAIDYDKGLLLRLRGVEIRRDQLPKGGHSCVYEIGERPSVNPNSWKMPKNFHHFYGKIPYPVRDVDPVLSSHWNREGELLIGVRIRNQFYAMESLGKIRKNTATMKAIEIEPPLHVVNVQIPRHRTNDLDGIAAKVRAEYVPTTDD